MSDKHDSEATKRDESLGTRRSASEDSSHPRNHRPAEPTTPLRDFTLATPAFGTGEAIPFRHSRDGGNVSPRLEWSTPPPGTLSFLLMLEDPDAPAPAFRHWVVYDIPPERRHLAEGGSSKAHEEDLPHAVNSFGNAGYDGPQPPRGDPEHTYRFRLVAIGASSLDVGPHPTAAEVWEAARSHIRGEAELVGTYQARSRSEP